jgi:hypothetical protein
VSDDQTGPTVGEPPADPLVPPQTTAPAPTREQPPEGKRSQGALIAVGLVLALALGALAAAVISNGDKAPTSTTIQPTTTVVSGHTTVKRVTTTVTTPPPNITVTPDVTLAPDGSAVTGPKEGGSQTDTAGGAQTDTTPATTTTP